VEDFWFSKHILMFLQAGFLLCSQYNFCRSVVLTFALLLLGKAGLILTFMITCRTRPRHSKAKRTCLQNLCYVDLRSAMCWDRPSALARINRRLLLGSTIGSCSTVGSWWDRPSALRSARTLNLTQQTEEEEDKQ
jgi:hypothetical protein